MRDYELPFTRFTSSRLRTGSWSGIVDRRGWDLSISGDGLISETSGKTAGSANCSWDVDGYERGE